MGDIGAGCGLFLEGLRKLWPDSHLFAIEPSGEMASLDHSKGLTVFQRTGEDLEDSEGQFDLLTAVLNAACGGLIDERALLENLDDGRIAGAWLDAFDEEPYRGPLTRYPQVILTPHVGSYTQECRRRMELEAVNNLLVALGELDERHFKSSCSQVS